MVSCKRTQISYAAGQVNSDTYPKQGFLDWITFNINSSEADNPHFLKFIGVSVDVEIRPWIAFASILYMLPMEP
jgi:hypothetical protein